MDVNTLNTLVSSAIWRAEQLDELGLEAASSAWLEVSKLEEELAKIIPAEDPEGRIARRGAVRAALKSNELDHAEDLARRYAADGAPSALRSELRVMLKAEANGLSEQFPHAAKHHRPSDVLRHARLLFERGPFSLAAA
jgi:hypothetical protein